MDNARSDGFFDLEHPDKARKLLGEAATRARKHPDYAEAFLIKLGAKDLRYLIENYTGDPCDLSDLVAAASQAGAGMDILTDAVGDDRYDAPRRAARNNLLGDMQAGIYSLAYVAVLADPSLRAALG